MIYVGIDVAKDKHDCFAMNSDGEILIEKMTIQNNFDENTRCDEAICPCPGRDSDGNCVIPDDGMVTCTYRDSNGTEHDITCAWKG